MTMDYQPTLRELLLQKLIHVTRKVQERKRLNHAQLFIVHNLQPLSVLLLHSGVIDKDSSAVNSVGCWIFLKDVIALPIVLSHQLN